MWILLAKPVLISVVSKSCGWFCIYTSLWSWDPRQCLDIFLYTPLTIIFIIFLESNGRGSKALQLDPQQQVVP